MSRSADPLRILIVMAVTAAIGVKVLYSVYGETPAKNPKAVGTARLAGRVTNVDGAALSGATVRLYGGGQGFSATTDLRGHYSFSGLPAGDYYVYAANPGFLQTYYGEQPLHHVMERCTWHSAQHARQMIAVLERLGVEPKGKLTAADYAGLPMPQGLWE